MGALTRAPAMSTVQTTSPARKSSTATGPRGVSISVWAARQMGQVGKLGSCAWTVTEPWLSISPVMMKPSPGFSSICS